MKSLLLSLAALTPFALSAEEWGEASRTASAAPAPFPLYWDAEQWERGSGAAFWRKSSEPETASERSAESPSTEKERPRAIRKRRSAPSATAAAAPPRATSPIFSHRHTEN